MTKLKDYEVFIYDNIISIDDMRIDISYNKYSNCYTIMSKIIKLVRYNMSNTNPLYNTVYDEVLNASYIDNKKLSNLKSVINLHSYNFLCDSLNLLLLFLFPNSMKYVSNNEMFNNNISKYKILKNIKIPTENDYQIFENNRMIHYDSINTICLNIAMNTNTLLLINKYDNY